MSKQRFISVLEITPTDRADILDIMIIRHPNLYFRHVTEAYDVGRHHQVPNVTEVMAPSA